LNTSHEVTHIRFLKPWSTVEGTKVICYPKNCIAPVGIHLHEITKKQATLLLNNGRCEPATTIEDK
jgi:hypothetical protein